MHQALCLHLKALSLWANKFERKICSLLVNVFMIRNEITYTIRFDCGQKDQFMPIRHRWFDLKIISCKFSFQILRKRHSGLLVVSEWKCFLKFKVCTEKRIKPTLLRQRVTLAGPANTLALPRWSQIKTCSPSWIVLKPSSTIVFVWEVWYLF